MPGVSDGGCDRRVNVFSSIDEAKSGGWVGYVDGVQGCKWWWSHGAGAEGKSAAPVCPVVGVCDSECWSDLGKTGFGVTCIVELM